MKKTRLKERERERKDRFTSWWMFGNEYDNDNDDGYLIIIIIK